MTRVWKVWADTAGDSSLAMRLDDDADDWRGGRERRSDESVGVLVVHMTGRTIVAKALREGLDPLEKCLSYYTTKRTSSHYLIGYDGELWQMTDDRIRVGHVGVETPERALYLNGGWAQGVADHEGRKISKATVASWRKAWPHYKSPQHLFHTKSVNNVSVGIEMPPCYVNGGYIAPPLRKGLWHTAAQHLGVALLACDLADRWGWGPGWLFDPKGGPRSPALPGHEDVDLYGRSQPSGGWDPGALRAQPRWDWPMVHSLIGMRLAAGGISAFLARAASAVGVAATRLF